MNAAVFHMDIGIGHWLWMAACNAWWYVVRPFCKLSPSRPWPPCVCVCLSGRLPRDRLLWVTLQWRAWAAPCTSESPDQACCPRVAGRWTAGRCRPLLPRLPCWRPAGTGGGARGVPCRQSARCGSRPPRPRRWSCGRQGCRSSCSWWSCAASCATPGRLRRTPGRTPLWQW